MNVLENYIQLFSFNVCNERPCFHYLSRIETITGNRKRLLWISCTVSTSLFIIPDILDKYEDAYHADNTT